MAFAKTNWQPFRAGGTQLTAAQLNRIEQGIDDLYTTRGGKALVQDFVAQTTLSVAGLDGDAHRGYDVWLDWMYDNTSVSENSPWIQPAAGLVAAASAGPDLRWDAAGAFTNGGFDTTRSALGISLGTTLGAATGRVRGLVTGKLLCRTGGAGVSTREVVFEGFVFYRAPMGAADKRARGGYAFGYYEITNNVADFQVKFDNAPATGKIILSPIVGSF